MYVYVRFQASPSPNYLAPISNSSQSKNVSCSKAPLSKIFALLSVLLEEIYPFIELSCQQLSISFVSILFSFLMSILVSLSSPPQHSGFLTVDQLLRAFQWIYLSCHPLIHSLPQLFMNQDLTSAIHESGSHLGYS